MSESSLKAKIMIKNKLKSIVLLSGGLLLAGLAQGQESVNAAGGDASGSGGSIAYSVGQVFCTTNTSTSGTISQGVQQAYEFFSVGIKVTELNITLSIFPNPTVDNIFVQIGDYNKEKLSYQLFDMQGKLINVETITSKQTQVNMSNLPPATYFINIVQENKKIQIFKIIKN